jgi:pilus assembly protein CpaC
VVGKKPGQTLLKVGNEYQQIQVLRFVQSQSHQRLQNFTKSTLALQTEIKQGQVLLKGTLQSLQELKRLEQICVDDQCDFLASYKVPEHLREGFQQHLRNMLKEHSVLSHQIIWEPHIRLLVPPNLHPKMSSNRGSRTHQQNIQNNPSSRLRTDEAEADEDRKEDLESNSRGQVTRRLLPLQRSFARIGIEVEAHPQVLDLAPSIELQLMILEARKNSLERYGISWPQTYSAQVLPSYQQIDELALSAQFLEAGGFARVLASPRILARSGEDAEFLAGGEIPIRVSGYKTQDVVWKRYGILMKMNAKVDLDQKMSIQIETEISSLDRSVTIDGVPGFKTNRVRSHFDLSGPRTIALSGLIRAEDSKAQEGLLGLQHLPILGRLFSSREFQRQQSELIILVRPREHQHL